MQALANINEQDVNGNGWPDSGRYIDGYLCSVLFFEVFYSLCMCSREAHSEHIL